MKVSNPSSQIILSDQPVSPATMALGQDFLTSYFHHFEVTQHQSSRQTNSLEFANEYPGFTTQSNQSIRQHPVNKWVEEHSHGILH